MSTRKFWKNCPETRVTERSRQIKAESGAMSAVKISETHETLAEAMVALLDSGQCSGVQSIKHPDD